ncbi:cell division cycle-associated protein 3-like isoform X1 [Branchiostoma lanceolatum]|uniref:cell division cycle-associated protein 3-like isoform X1 n=1 Tax=Branchiostoma lanceolatum TaxID=7740 RepID=UPI003456EF78
MGAFESKSWASLDDSTSSTPPEQRKVLQFDPRSPTSGIERTPIQIEKTTEVFVDPRSPTREVERTPIRGSDKDSYREPWCYDSELSLDLSTSSVCRLLDDDPDASPQMPDIQVTPPGRGSSRASRQTPQYERELCDMMDNLTGGGTAQEDTRLLKAKGRKITSKQKWGWGNGMFKAVKPAEKPVKIHPNNRKVLFTATGNLPRSPLTTRNDENPRALVQQKQMARLGLTKTVQRPIRLTSKYKLFSDKENVEIK